METTEFNLTFAEFAESVRPTGAINRFPRIGPGPDHFSYSVYMNGPQAKKLPVHAQEHTFKDVMLHALTAKLNLNAENARDNLKVAELVAVRSAWMAAVLEASIGQGLRSEKVNEDYTKLLDGMSHPWISGELDKQRALSSTLHFSMAKAGVQKDIVPEEVSLGVVLAQDKHFTFQKTKAGEVVTHENSRLGALPSVGQDVSVTYYRGTGQVVRSLENFKVSPPFIDPVTEDLAIVAEDGMGSSQVLLFNSMASFDKFVKAHGLGADLVRQALDAREAAPKVANAIPPRKLVRSPYIDERSGNLAIDYEEHEVVYTALFNDAATMASLAKEFDLGAKAIAMAHSLHAERVLVTPLNSLGEEGEMDSQAKLQEQLLGLGYTHAPQDLTDGRHYMGKIVSASAFHVAQDIGRHVVVVHDTRALDKLPAVGDMLTVKYDKGRGAVSDLFKATGKDLGR